MNPMRILVLVALASLLVVPPAIAGKTFELVGGIGVPTGDLSDETNSGLTAGAGFFGEFQPFVSGGFSFAYSRFSLDDEMLPTAFTYDGGELSVMRACLEVRLKSGHGSFGRYWAGVGGGLFHFSRNDITISDGVDSVTVEFESESKIGAILNAGFAIPMTPTSALGLKAEYSVVSVGEDYGFEGGDTISFINVVAVFQIDM